MSIIVKNEPVVNETVTGNLRRGTNSGSCSKTPNTVYSSSNPTRRYKVHTMEGRSTPGWQRLRNSGAILPMTVFKQFEYESISQEVARDYCDASGRRWWWESNFHPGAMLWCHTASLPLDDIVNPSDLEYLVQQAASSIASSGWDALTFLAELKQLRRMFSGVVTKLDRLTSGRSVGRAYDLWLEGRYGWRVLAYDIRDLHEVLTNYREKRTRYNQKVGNTFNDLIERNDQSTSATGTYGVYENITVQVNLRATVVADMSVPKLQFNPVTTAWEVTRLSFVLDWLVNVGQALNAATFLLLAKDYSAAGGYRIDFDVAGQEWLVSPATGYTFYSHEAGYTGSGYYEERVPMSVSSLPRLKLRLDPLKALDLLSLVLQRII